MRRSYSTLTPKSTLPLLTYLVCLCAVAVADLPSMYEHGSYYSPHEDQPGLDSHLVEPYGGGQPHSMDYLSDWRVTDWGLNTGQQTRCVDIPQNLTLCQNIGYKQMRLPNLLEHETMAEVQEQARSWLTLVALNCHADSKIFLCSLYAPICVQELAIIYPCRSLCVSVREKCAPRMQERGFAWPEMLTCDRFPLDNDMCVKREETRDVVCEACSQPSTFYSVIDNYCNSDIVMKVKIQKTEKSGSAISITTGRRKRFLKHGVARTMTSRQLRALEITIADAAKCRCPDNMKGTYLISGSLQGGQFVVKSLHKYDKGNTELVRVMRAIRRNTDVCDIQGEQVLASGIGNIDPQAQTTHPSTAAPSTTTTTTTREVIQQPRTCPQCQPVASTPEFNGIFCQSDVVFRIALVSATNVGSRTRLQGNRMKVYLKLDTINSNELTEAELVMEHAHSCLCDLVNTEKYVIAGSWAPGKVYINGIYSFDRDSDNLKSSLSAFRNRDTRDPCINN